VEAKQNGSFRARFRVRMSILLSDVRLIVRI